MARLKSRYAVQAACTSSAAFVGGFLLAITLEVAHAAALLTGGSGFREALTGTLATDGVIEPVATKLVPALFIAYMARTQVPAAVERLERG